MSELSDSQKAEPGVEGGWSIKDIMAHIAAWEKLAQYRINAALTGETLKYPVIKGDNFVDIFNLDVYESNKDLPLSEIQSEFQRSHNIFLEQIKLVEDDTLSQILPFDWAGKLTFQVLISANSHWHYAEHAESIERWIQR